MAPDPTAGSVAAIDNPRGHVDPRLPGIRLVVPVLWYGVILTLTLLPGSSFPTVPDVEVWSYVVHAGLFGALAATLWWAQGATRRAVWPTVAAGAVLGAVDELLQAGVPSRDPSLLDLVVDIAAVAVVAALLARRQGAAG